MPNCEMIYLVLEESSASGKNRVVLTTGSFLCLRQKPCSVHFAKNFETSDYRIDSLLSFCKCLIMHTTCELFCIGNGSQDVVKVISRLTTLRHNESPRRKQTGYQRRDKNMKPFRGKPRGMNPRGNQNLFGYKLLYISMELVW